MSPTDGGGYGHCDIQGLTDPANFLSAAVPLYKRRGRLTAAVVSTNWVERLFLLTDAALMWFDLGSSLVPRSEPLGTQQGRVDVRQFVSMSQTENSASRTGLSP